MMIMEARKRVLYRITHTQEILRRLVHQEPRMELTLSMLDKRKDKDYSLNMKNYIVIILICSLTSCTQNKQSHFVTIQKGDKILKGRYVADAIFNDTVWTYDLKDHLIEKSFFIEGKTEGVSTEFYLNGKIRALTSYTNGLKNGYTS